MPPCFFGPIEDRVGVLRKGLPAVLEAQKDQVPADHFPLKRHAFRIVMPFRVPMDNALRRRYRIVFSVDHGEVLIGVLDFAVARVGHHGNHRQVIHLHHVHKLLRGEHFFLIRAPAANAPVNVRVPGKPTGRLGPSRRLPERRTHDEKANSKKYW